MCKTADIRFASAVMYLDKSGVIALSEECSVLVHVLGDDDTTGLRFAMVNMTGLAKHDAIALSDALSTLAHEFTMDDAASTGFASGDVKNKTRKAIQHRAPAITTPTTGASLVERGTTATSTFKHHARPRRAEKFLFFASACPLSVRVVSQLMCCPAP